jgi:hypothetical protein
MADPTGESESDALRLDFDRRPMLQFRGSVVTSNAGLLADRELDDVPGLMLMASDVLADARTGRNGRHALHRAPVLQEARKSASIHARQGFTWGIPYRSVARHETR